VLHAALNTAPETKNSGTILWTALSMPPEDNRALRRWRETLFMHHNVQPPGTHFQILRGQIMEVELEFEI
jgi:hypothetical protein